MHFDTFKFILYYVFTFIYVLSMREQCESTKGRPLLEKEEKALSVIQKWAPKIWLHPQEMFFPSSVKNFMEGVYLKKLNCFHCAQSIDKLPTGSESSNFLLTTIQDRDKLLWNQSSFLYGSNPSKNTVPVYAFVSTCDPSFKKFSVTYWFFYPFNEGKGLCSVRVGRSKVLPMLKLFRKCLGKTVTYGRHVGDWEHMTLEIRNFVPSRLFLSVHHVGVYYKYNAASNQFVISSCRSQGFSEAQDPPATVRVVGGRPTLFVANGSHALWGSTGSFKYTKLRLDQLVDKTGYGPSWETWKDLQVFFPFNAPDWFYFQGQWGNSRTGCLDLNQRFGVCLFSDGPKGLAQRRLDFGCKKKNNFRLKPEYLL